ncbi:MAG: polysaccharide biosynthesis/export family protein [Alphaproteobacteria bacterium]
MAANQSQIINLGILPVLFFGLGACANPVAHIPELRPEQLTAKPVTQQRPYEQTYKMVPYDIISVRFTYHPEADPKAPISIRPDGQITLDAVGSIQAAGRTPEELGKEIAAKASTRLRNPVVVVTITKFAPRKIYVGGQVKTPGIVEFQGEMTPIQAIFDRGGFTNEAQVDSVILIRNAGGPEPVIGRINVNQSLEDGTPEKITLLTNDVIYVPMSGIGRADLWVKQHLNDIVPSGLLGAAGMGAAFH